MEPTASTSTPSRKLLASVARNLLAFVVFYAAAFVLLQIGFRLGPVALAESLQLLGGLIALGIAMRLDARVSAVIIAAFDVYIAVELLAHARYGWQAVQGGPTHFAVLAASFAGVILGAMLAPRLRGVAA